MVDDVGKREEEDRESRDASTESDADQVPFPGQESRQAVEGDAPDAPDEEERPATPAEMGAPLRDRSPIGPCRRHRFAA